MKEKLIRLLKKDEFISGEVLAEKLGVSRTAVWKQINSLKNFGYDIVSIKNKGYMLVSKPDIPISEEVKTGLHTKVIGGTIFHFDRIDSTNSYGKKLVKKQVREGTVVVSEIQTGGRGRKNRLWESPKGGLWFSVILFPPIPPQKAMYVTMSASIAIVKAIKDICDLQAEIKWPNDILLKGKKVCGILTELDAELDRMHSSIIGIGINVNNDVSKGLEHIATSLHKEAGKKISRVRLLRFILQYFDEIYQFILLNDFERIRKSWLQFTTIIGKEICVHGEREVIKGRVSGIDENGCLLLVKENKVQHIATGDIEYI